MGGNLRKIESVDQVYVNNIQYDHFEQRTSINYGNGTTTNYTYTPELRRLTNLQLDVNGGQLQNIDYQYDFVGNITRMDNNASPITNNSIGGNYSHRYN